RKLGSVEHLRQCRVIDGRVPAYQRRPEPQEVATVVSVNPARNPPAQHGIGDGVHMRREPPSSPEWEFINSAHGQATPREVSVLPGQLVHKPVVSVEEFLPALAIVVKSS